MNQNSNKAVNMLFEAFTQFSKLPWNNSPVEGLNSSEVFILLCIERLTDLTIHGVKVSEISRALNVSPPTVTQLINALEKKEFVERNYNKEDRRVVRISITERGKAAINSAYESFNNIFTGLVEFLGEVESLKLTELLSKVFNYFDNINIQTG